ncbi:MAG TPA: tyrosine-type recombinase/integrase [Terriglobales bacterium]
MSLLNRNGNWHYRFKFHGKPYRKTTGLDATEQNKRAAQVKENEHFQRLKDGRKPSHDIVVREFSDAAKQFLGWAETKYRKHPNSYKRIKTSFASALDFFENKSVSMLDEGEIESYKVLRIDTHEVRDVTLRHDLHALSVFFSYAIKQHWTRENPLRNVEIPSDKEAVRMHILTASEEKLYFERAAADRDLHDLGRLIILQGMRPDEVTSLAKCDVDLDLGQLQVVQGKTPAARRTLTLTTESRRILAARIESDSPWIFPGKWNPARHVSRLNSSHDRLCHRAKADGVLFNFVLYDFRHTFATRRATATQGDRFDLASLAAILGHSSLRMIQKYVHPTAEHQRALMQKYDEILAAAERLALSEMKKA